LDLTSVSTVPGEGPRISQVFKVFADGFGSNLAQMFFRH